VFNKGHAEWYFDENLLWKGKMPWNMKFGLLIGTPLRSGAFIKSIKVNRLRFTYE